MKNNVKAALKTLMPETRAVLSRWLRHGDSTNILPDEMPGILSEFRLLTIAAVLQAQEHYFRHHNFMVVSNIDDIFGFYRDAAGVPCVCIVPFNSNLSKVRAAWNLHLKLSQR